MQITKQLLLDSGYKEYAHHEKYNAFKLYQKRITDTEAKTLYFIQAYIWYWPVQAGPNISVSFDARLSQAGLGSIVNVEVSPQGTTMSLDNVESFFRRAYVGLNCVPDIHNND
jgi:hypothetical protein